MSDDRPGKGWVSVREMAHLWDCTENYVRRELLPFAGADDRQTVGQRLWLRGRAILDAWSDRRRPGRRGEAPQAGPGPNGDEVLFAGSDSPQLERYRAARADLAEMEVLERQGQLIPTTQVETCLASIRQLWRQHGDVVQRQFGQDAARLHNETLAEIDRVIRERFDGRDGDADETEPGAA